MIIEERGAEERIIAEQNKDDELRLLRTAIKEKNSSHPELSKFRPSFPSLRIIEDVVYQVKKDGQMVVVVPQHMRQGVLGLIHNGVLAGHFGVSKSYAALKRRYFWPNMLQDIRNFIDSCTDCAKWKRTGKYQSVKLQPVDYENRIGHQISIDFKGPLPETKVTELYPIKHRFVLLIVDNASKYIMAVPTANMTAEVTAEALITKWMPLFGVCDTIICDNGTGFKSKLFQNICDRLQITMNNSSPYNPRANGLVEVNNKLLGTMLFSMVKDKVNEWNQFLDFVISGYNSSIHTTTKFSPNYLVFGRELVQPVDIIFGFDNQPRKTKGWKEWDVLMRDRVQTREKALYQAYQNNREVQEKNSRDSEESAHAKELKVGDRCAVSLPRKRKKHLPPWDTNYVVVDQVTPTTYLIRNITNEQTMTISRRFLKLVIDRNNLSNSQEALSSPSGARTAGEDKDKKTEEEHPYSTKNPTKTNKRSSKKYPYKTAAPATENESGKKGAATQGVRPVKPQSKGQAKKTLGTSNQAVTGPAIGKHSLRDRRTLKKPERT